MRQHSSQVWSIANASDGRFDSPVALVSQICRSARPRPRFSASRKLMSVSVWSVTSTWNRCPSMSVKVSCAPGCAISWRSRLG